MQLPNRWGNGMKCPIWSSPFPCRQWAGQEIACSWPQSHNSQDAQNMQESMLWASDPKLPMISTDGADDLRHTHNNSNKKHWTPRTNMHVRMPLSHMHLVEPPALPRTPHAYHVAELVTGIQIRSQPNMGLKWKTKADPHHQCRQQLWPRMQWGLCHPHRCSPTSFCLYMPGPVHCHLKWPKIPTQQQL